MWIGFSRDRSSVAMPTEVARRLQDHLKRPDGQEDLSFVLWRPSLGRARASALVVDLVLPDEGERHVHGDVSFEGEYFLRSARAAALRGCGVGLIHSHPGGTGWQGLSPNDFRAEAGHAAQAEAITQLPFLGMTLGTRSGLCSARLWKRVGPRHFEPAWCESVRVVGDEYRVNYDPAQRPPPPMRPSQVRTVSAWGRTAQDDLARIRVGIIGAGSVGALVGEALARMGVTDVTLLDFDLVEEKNLDRLLHATQEDARAGRAKVDVLRRGLMRSSTAAAPRIRGLQVSVSEPDGLAEALDQDVLFCCVDRPWGRQIANYLAYVHLIPVVDGGVQVDAGKGRMRGATWRAHVAAPGRRCLECLGQYDPADVALERSGHLDDPTYIQGLTKSSLPTGENVFAFAAAAASAEVLQFLSMVVIPAGTGRIGAQTFHFSTGTSDLDKGPCQGACLYSGRWFARGDALDVTVTGIHEAAVQARRAMPAPEACPQGPAWIRGFVSKMLRSMADRMAPDRGPSRK